MPTNDDTPTIDDVLYGVAEECGVINFDITRAKAAIQNLIDRARLDERKSAVASISKEYDSLIKSNDEYFSAEFKNGYYGALRDMTLDAKDAEQALEAKIKEGDPNA